MIYALPTFTGNEDAPKPATVRGLLTSEFRTKVKSNPWILILDAMSKKKGFISFSDVTTGPARGLMTKDHSGKVMFRDGDPGGTTYFKGANLIKRRVAVHVAKTLFRYFQM